MKPVVIVLGLLVAVLAFAFFQQRGSASRAAEAATKDLETMTNQVAEYRTKMTLAQVTAASTSSNLQHQLDKRTADLNVISNRLVQTHLLLQAAQTDARSTQEQLQARIARVVLLEAENEQSREQARRAASSDPVRENAALQRQLAEAGRDREALRAQLAKQRVDLDALQSRLFDVEFLDRQRKDAEMAADIRRRMASARAGASPDPRQKLALQPDGTVRYVAPAGQE